MGVAAHLGIRLDEYDARIRTFIPHYEEMLDVAAAAVRPDSKRIVDLGTGTGSLAARCLARAPGAHLVCVDADAEILQVAARRLGQRATLVAGRFSRVLIPPADAVVASFALHHIRTRDAKAKLYRRIHAALARGGRFISVDCQPASEAMIGRGQRLAWEAHLRKTYSPKQGRRLLADWAEEDVYVPLDREIALTRSAGFRVEVLWRRDAFAVILGVI